LVIRRENMNFGKKRFDHKKSSRKLKRFILRTKTFQ